MEKNMKTIRTLALLVSMTIPLTLSACSSNQKSTQSVSHFSTAASTTRSSNSPSSASKASSKSLHPEYLADAIQVKGTSDHASAVLNDQSVAKKMIDLKGKSLGLTSDQIDKFSKKIAPQIRIFAESGDSYDQIETAMDAFYGDYGDVDSSLKSKFEALEKYAQQFKGTIKRDDDTSRPLFNINNTISNVQQGDAYLLTLTHNGKEVAQKRYVVGTIPTGKKIDVATILKGHMLSDPTVGWKVDDTAVQMIASDLDITTESNGSKFDSLDVQLILDSAVKKHDASKVTVDLDQFAQDLNKKRPLDSPYVFTGNGIITIPFQG